MTAQTGTLLSKLGFDDADRKHPEHDMACVYLAQPAMVHRMADLIVDKINKTDLLEPFSIEREELFVRHEDPIYGGYKNGIVRGFADLTIGTKISQNIIGEQVQKFLFIVEVKIGKTSASDILRQLNTYRNGQPWSIAAVRWRMSQTEIEMLRSSNVLVIRLAEGFDEWLKTNGGQGTEDATL